MRARSIELYCLPSLTRMIGEEPLTLIDQPGRQAILTGSNDERALHLRRRNALGAFLTSSLMGDGPYDKSPRERFDLLFAAQAIQWSSAEDGLLLIIDCEDEVADRKLEHTLDLEDFAISLDSEAQAGFGETAHLVRNAALTALALAAFDGVTHDGKSLGIVRMIFETGSDCPTYIISPQVSMTMTSKSTLLPEQAIQAVRLTEALSKAPKNLGHVPRLLAQSYENRLQVLASFISAWAGLEIFIAVTFNKYEILWNSTINDNIPSSGLNILDRIQHVMKDKYRLSDKFTIIATVLDPLGAEKDAITFLSLKKTCDTFFHTLATDPENLPGEETRRLLKKYLSLHLKQL